MKDGRRLTGGRLFADMIKARSNGFRLDTQGSLWISEGSGVHCYTQQGGLVLKISLPEAVNLVFGSSKHNRLFITSYTSLYSVSLG